MRRPGARAATESERKERLGYVILQHLDTFVDDATGTLVADHIAADLAIPADELHEILDMLTRRGFIDWDGTRGHALPTTEGSDYLAHTAGRRRSVRFHAIARRGQPPAMRPVRARYRTADRSGGAGQSAPTSPEAAARSSTRSMAARTGSSARSARVAEFTSSDSPGDP